MVSVIARERSLSWEGFTTAKDHCYLPHPPSLAEISRFSPSFWYCGTDPDFNLLSRLSQEAGLTTQGTLYVGHILALQRTLSSRVSSDTTQLP